MSSNLIVSDFTHDLLSLIVPDCIQMGEDSELDLIISNLKQFKGITEKQVKFITDLAISVFMQESNV